MHKLLDFYRQFSLVNCWKHFKKASKTQLMLWDYYSWKIDDLLQTVKRAGNSNYGKIVHLQVPVGAQIPWTHKFNHLGPLCFPMAFLACYWHQFDLVLLVMLLAAHLASSFCWQQLKQQIICCEIAFRNAPVYQISIDHLKKLGFFQFTMNREFFKRKPGSCSNNNRGYYLTLKIFYFHNCIDIHC